MVDERSSLTKVVGKTKKVFQKYGSTSPRADDVVVETKQKYEKFKLLKKLWKWRSSKKTNEELLEEGTSLEQKDVKIVTYALCFIMMLAGLTVKMD
ncbi:Hypothetical protein CINCED_3A014315 [Cinara cedri]|uniref:Uncharacterized protein n=1 Tax=Cinara cedri TaxID=506608 RepID=A0A5E4MQR8_9HEMI|nr:Hypothetical protein CINCED_3A014315 [Cinara cedri]